MVSIYFDKEFIRLFNQRNDLTDPIIYDFYNQFLKKIRGVDIFLNLESVDELKDLIQNNELYYYLSEINSPLLFDFKSSLSDLSFFKQGNISKLFFVEELDEEELELKSNYYFISNKTLKNKWNLFLSDRDDNELVIKSNTDSTDKKYFNSWEKLRTFAHFTNHILVFDLYIMGNKANQKIRDNLLPCIKELINSNRVEPEELTIFTYELADANQVKRELKGLWLEKELLQSLSYLADLNKNIKNITLIKYDESKNFVSDSEHNRCILTNYFFIRTEAGFNIFKGNGKVNNADSIRFDSILKNKIRNVVKEKIENLKSYVSKIKKVDTKALGTNNVIEHYNFYPDITCRYLEDSTRNL